VDYIYGVLPASPLHCTSSFSISDIKIKLHETKYCLLFCMGVELGYSNYGRKNG